MNNPKTKSKTISFVGDTSIKSWIEDLSEKHGRSASWMYRNILHQARELNLTPTPKINITAPEEGTNGTK